MTRWKVVPVDATDEMWLAQRRFASGDMKWIAMLAAAPAFEPDHAMVERAVHAYRAELTRIYDAVDRLEAGDCYSAMRAALKAAFEEPK